jgi:hypothetical protein
MTADEIRQKRKLQGPTGALEAPALEGQPIPTEYEPGQVEAFDEFEPPQEPDPAQRDIFSDEMGGIEVTRRPPLTPLEPSQFPEVEERWQAAKGIDSPTIRQRAADALQKARELGRHFPHLDMKGDPVHARVGDQLRTYEASGQYAQVRAMNTITEIVGDLDINQVDLMTRNLELPDHEKDIEAGLYEGRELDWGYTSLDALRSDIAHFRGLQAADPKVKAGYDRRMAVHGDVTKMLVEEELLPASVLEDPRYFHRQVMAYVNLRARTTGTGTADAHIRKRSWQKRRVGGSDANTSYQEAEFE